MHLSLLININYVLRLTTKRQRDRFRAWVHMQDIVMAKMADEICGLLKQMSGEEQMERREGRGGG